MMLPQSGLTTIHSLFLLVPRLAQRLDGHIWTGSISIHGSSRYCERPADRRAANRAAAVATDSTKIGPSASVLGGLSLFFGTRGAFGRVYCNHHNRTSVGRGRHGLKSVELRDERDRIIRQRQGTGRSAGRCRL